MIKPRFDKISSPCKICPFPNLIDNFINTKIWLFFAVVETIVGYL